MGGNDFLLGMRACASKEKTPEECMDEILDSYKKRMPTLLDMVHEQNRHLKIVGFGYDLMFGGDGCKLIARALMPQCFRGNIFNEKKSNKCVNTIFLKIQEVTLI